MTFSLLQGCDGQAIAVDLRTDVHHPHHRHPRLFHAHRRPHAAAGHSLAYVEKDREHLKKMCL